MFVDYHKCQRYLKGRDCEYFKRVYSAICPNFWIKRWEEQMEAGTFPYPLPGEKDNKGGKKEEEKDKKKKK